MTAGWLGSRYPRSIAMRPAMVSSLSQLTSADEGLRAQIAAELHDTVAQTLMLARAALAAAEGDAGQLRHVQDLIGEAEDQVRGLLSRARPLALRDGDLRAAVGVLCDDLANRYGLAVSVRWSPPAPDGSLPPALAVTVYRFFQEALLNVVKHADVPTACLSFFSGPAGCSATVSDTGAGFDPAERLRTRGTDGRHVGLSLLGDRIRAAGGTLDVTSAPGSGTAVTLRVDYGTAPEYEQGAATASGTGGTAGPVATARVAAGAATRAAVAAVAAAGLSAPRTAQAGTAPQTF
ncbi:MAG: histidine kinase [Actinomycetota bacterium]|nr:histidine kinase [Actinomycetota bacterium]